MSVIAVVMQKGGVGKTTIATNLAGAAAHRGHRVRLFDANPTQGSAYGWSKMRPEGDSLTAVRVDGDFRKAVLADIPNYDHIIIDTPPDLNMETRTAMAVADVIVVPIRIGQYDIWSVSQTAKVVDDLKILRPLRAIAFVNAVPHYIKAELDEALGTIRDFPDTFEPGPTLIDRGGFRRTAKLGLAVTELPSDFRDLKATDEFETLYEQVFRG
jgi:chromosome partitioning protein